ncbi:hypothetical protein LAWI1_G001486 [Lachnellula willkommii]|uniref:Rhodopsin domain-containing protein n=1 Tax=Lachnellula willkommii TaxID=215461 RepID=A0A559MKL1_9HELO|nr:hypothetical protein LAWI1_G001486 [Lachnellula willkommii]
MSSQLLSMIHIGFNTPENQRMINQSGRIPKLHFEVVSLPSLISTGIPFGIAATTVILRTARRLIIFRRLELDDAFVWFGLLCLSAATGILFHNMSTIMLQEAIAMVPDVTVPISDVSKLINSISFLDAFLCSIWTCTFAKLIQGISKNLNRYYWLVVGYTFLAWVFLIVEPFILCPYFGIEGAKCYPEYNYPKTFWLTIVISIIDIASDLMIASNPILLLRKSRMKTKQRLSLYVFLCLSFVMAIFALTRVAGFKHKRVIDDTWSLYWQYCEGCIACIMASVTPFRAIFVNGGSQSPRRKTRGPSSSLRALWKKPSKNSEKERLKEMGSNNTLPKPPGPLISGLITFIKQNNRVAEDSTVLVTNTFGTEEMISGDPSREYQEYLRRATGPLSCPGE